MKIIDLVFLIILLVGAYSGFKKGLFLEIVTFLAFIIAIISAFKLLNTTIEFVKNTWHWNSVLIPYIAFVLIFCAVFFGIHLLGKALKKILDFTLLGSLDSIAGALLGVFKMAFALSLLLWLTEAASIEFPDDVTVGSFLFRPLSNLAPRIVSYISFVIPFQDIFPSIKRVLAYS